MELLVIAMLIPMSIGIIIIYKNIRPFMRNMKTRTWDNVPGKVTHIYNREKWIPLHEVEEPYNTIALKTKEGESSFFKSFTFDPVLVKYEFKHNGKTFTSTDITLDKEPTNLPPFENDPLSYYNYLPVFIVGLQSNPKVNVWVNPENSQEAILVPRQHNYFSSVVLGAVLIIWVVCIITIAFPPSITNIAKKLIVIEQKQVIEEQP